MYMIYNPQANQPRAIHNDIVTANTEAMRLARLHPGQKFYVMKAQGYYSVAAPEPVYTPMASMASTTVAAWMQANPIQPRSSGGFLEYWAR